MRSRRLIATPGLFSGDAFPTRLASQERMPMSQRASAWSAVVFPELFGPMNTTALPSSISACSNLLKFRIVSLVSMRLFQRVITKCYQHGRQRERVRGEAGTRDLLALAVSIH